jgi:myo-inositol-1(or 4)-monophosphatase
MSASHRPLPSVEQLTVLVAAAAAREVLARFREGGAERKADGSLLTQADTGMQQALAEALATAFPGIPLLGEEMPVEHQRRLLEQTGDDLWCLDPLDGTGNFAAGIPVFSVSLALLRDHQVELGLVHDPVLGETFAAVRDRGAWLNGRPLRSGSPPQRLADATGLIDFKRLPPALASALAVRPPYRSQRSFGSVALDWCWVAAGRCHLYLHGGQRLWDYAAGSLILREAGGAGGLVDSYGGPWQAQPSLEPRIAIATSSESLLPGWLAWLEEAAQG